MKRIISIILCLTMVFAMTATAFGATALGSFEVRKTDADGNPLSGAEFVLISEGYSEAAYSASSNTDGVAVFSGVVDGTYTLKENAAPEGYIKSEDGYAIYVVNGEVYSGYAPDDAGNINPIPYSAVTYVNEKEQIDPITVYVPFIKIVEQTGSVAPGKETFAFSIYGFGMEGKVTVLSNTISTNGKGTYSGELIFEVEDEAILDEGFYVSEVKGSARGWTYDETVWYVMPDFNNGGWVFCKVNEIGRPELNNPENGMGFINSYFKINYAPMNPAPSVPEDVEENPDTGAPVFMAFAVIVLSGTAAIIGKIK